MLMLAEVRKLMVCRIFPGVQGATSAERVPCIVWGHFASNPDRINEQSVRKDVEREAERIGLGCDGFWNRAAVVGGMA
jgi:hypothetical protein